MCSSRITLLFCWLVSEVESFFALDVEDDGFILTSSASKAGASVLTTDSRSDCCVRDFTSEGIETEKKNQALSFLVTRIRV